MAKTIDVNNIPAEKFALAKGRDYSHDKKLDTKPIGYFKDAWMRFCKNIGSVIGFIIIGLLVLFAIVVPFFTPFTVPYSDTNFNSLYPKSELFEAIGIDFWDGCTNKQINETDFLEFSAIGQETGDLIIKNNKYTVVQVGKSRQYQIRYNSYHKVGATFEYLSKAEFKALQDYQDQLGVQIILPAVADLGRDKNGKKLVETYPQLKDKPNIWYKIEEAKTYDSEGNLSKKLKPIPMALKNADGTIAFDADGDVQFVNNYLQISDPSVYWDDEYISDMYLEGDTKQYMYSIKMQGEDQYKVRVNYYEYYIYKHKLANDGITRPSFLFGTNAQGKDILVCLAAGARLSFILAIVVSSVNMIVGAIYGAIEGYYGGVLDLFMERFSDILSAVPFMIVITLLKLHMGNSSPLLILFISFFLTGWIGMASRVRMQFYRFKNQEYVLAARTLGASDRRIMFKHIFPNSLGTIITGSILSIPGMIFSESSLSYLGIISLSGNITSVGNLLSSAQEHIREYPHMMLFPALFICLLMLSFNLFGNGLRDAFNPSLRGSEE